MIWVMKNEKKCGGTGKKNSILATAAAAVATAH